MQNMQRVNAGSELMHAGQMLLDTTKYTLFLSALAGSYVAVDEGLAILLGKERYLLLLCHAACLTVAWGLGCWRSCRPCAGADRVSWACCVTEHCVSTGVCANADEMLDLQRLTATFFYKDLELMSFVCPTSCWPPHLLAPLRRPRAQHHSLATYVLLRGVCLLVRCGNKHVAGARQAAA